MTVLDYNNQDKGLWRQYSSQADGLQAPDIDTNILAAYLDGSADPGQIELIEARLASDPQFLQELMDLRRISHLQTATAPASVLSRAKALGHRRVWPARMRWAAAAAGILFACLLGYTVGGATERGHQYAQSAVSPGTALQLDELISEPAFGIILPLNGDNGR